MKPLAYIMIGIIWFCNGCRADLYMRLLEQRKLELDSRVQNMERWDDFIGEVVEAQYILELIYCGWRRQWQES